MQEDWVSGGPRLAMVGATFRELGFERLGELNVAADELSELAHALRASELVLVRTCNRFECYLLGDDEGDLRAGLSAFFSERGVELRSEDLLYLAAEEALLRLFTVVGSLDSLVVGETEISGQARRALGESQRHGLVGERLGGLFERAVACSRRLRRETELGQLNVSVASLALNKVRKHFGSAGPRCAAVVGVGAMTRKVALTLRHGAGELLVVNRTLSRAEELAAACGGRPLALESFLREPPDALELVFTATSAESPLIGSSALRPALERRAHEGLGPLIVCDLGIPRDTAPELDRTPGAWVITLATMEQLAAHNRGRLEHHVARARQLVQEEAARTLRQERFTALAEVSAGGILKRRLAHLAPADQEQIRRFAAGLAARLARQPDSDCDGLSQD